MQTTATMPMASHPPPLRRPSEKVCLAITRLFTHGPLQRYNFRKHAPANRFDSYENYFADRVSHVDEYRRLFSRFTSFRDKTVLDLGCSSGYLLHSFLEHEPFTAIGADISPEVLTEARARYGDAIRWVQATPRSIPLADDSVDVVYTLDTVEHLSEPRAIFADTYRVLKPGGLFLSWRSPPTSTTPRTTRRRATGSTSARRPNLYLDREKWRVFLNKLTIAGFRRLIRELPFEEVHFQRYGFRGTTFKAGRALAWLAQTPILTEYFTGYTFCALRKPA